MSEELFTGPPGLPADGRGTVVTVGTFDGVHRGHQAVLREVCQRADSTGSRSVLLTFHPHPLRIVRPEDAPSLLTTPLEKKEILAETGLDFAVFLAFTPALSDFEPERFVREVLVDRVGVSELVIGYDHGFGRDRSGGMDTLRRLGQEMGFDVDVVEPVTTDEDAVSSTSIREAILDGDLEAATRRLGRPYSMRGVVVRGEGRGHDLGFPTANLEVLGGDKLVPPAGIYAVRGVLRGGSVDGALHIGPRPTFRGSPPTVELHLMDFEGDLYGEIVRVDFVKRLREVRPFASAGDLIEQMGADVEEARRVLAGGDP
ncbi:MAG: bifunctional riboflavin kinase/FAD synthetase [Longimicrobiales bacterium]